MIRPAKCASTAILVCALVIVGACSANDARAQGYSEGGGDSGPGNGFDGYTIEQFVSLNIDGNQNLDAYTEASVLNYTPDYSGYNLELQLTVTIDGSLLDFLDLWDEGSGAVSGDLTDTAQLGHAYEAISAASVLYICYDGNGIAGMCTTYFASQYASVNSGNPPPQVTSITPNSGNIGDSNVPITFYGYDLLNSDGTLPTFTTAPSSLQVTASSGTSQQINATYSIDPNAMLENGLIDVDTDGGMSNDTTFTTGAPSAVVTGLAPAAWSAGTTFTLTVSGTGFGNVPSVSISDPAGSITTGAPFNTAPDGTSTQVNVTVASNAPTEEATVTVAPSYIGSGFVSGNQQGGNGAGSNTAPVSGVTNPACPTSVSVDQIWTRALADDFPGYLTGVGILSRMIVGPVNINFNGTILYETVTPVLGSGSNSCPAAISANAVGFGPGFVIGNSTNWEKNPYQSEQNAFYDEHVRIAGTNVLADTGITACQAQAQQVYTCNGTAIGTFILTYNFSAGFIQSVPVTFVSVTKQ